MRRRGGFMMVEIFVGFGVLATAATVFLVAVSRGNLAFDQLAQRRQASIEAETVLERMQAGMGDASTDSRAQISVTSCGGSSEIPGWRWVRVNCDVGGQTRSLVGLVPSERAATTTRPASGGAP